MHVCVVFTMIVVLDVLGCTILYQRLDSGTSNQVTERYYTAQ